MAEIGLNQLLEGKEEGARCEIARRVGGRLAETDVSDVDRKAAEALARTLTEDALERVRIALAEAVCHAPLLPKDIALKIAHDIDSVAVPFLTFTEVFSESDWNQLVLTLSRGALVAVSGRSSMPDSLAQRLAEVGDSVVVGSLIENPAAPMTQPVCHTLIDRFEMEMWVLDKLAERGDLIADVAAALTLKVSSMAREKLMKTYKLDGAAGAVASEAETGALVQLAAETPIDDMVALVRRLHDENRLTPALALAGLEKGSLEFCAAALSLLSEGRLEQVRSIILRADDRTVIRLLTKARVPEESRHTFLAEIEAARARHKSS